MRIDFGEPSKRNISGIKKRIKKMNAIYPIQGDIGLDLGSGKGAYYRELNKYIGELFALDIELKFLEEFESNEPTNNNRLFVNNIESCSVKKNICDVIFAIEVLDHVQNLEKTMSEINRILKAGGYLYISVPNNYFPFETHLLKFGKFTIKGKYIPFISMFRFIHNKIGSARRFTTRDIERLSAIHGFEVIGQQYMMPPFDYWKVGKKLFLHLGEYLERSFLKRMSMSLILVLRKLR